MLATIVLFAQLVVQPDTPEVPELDMFNTKSPVWLSATLNSTTFTPARLVLTAVIAVPEVLALPVVMVEVPLVFSEAEFSPVTVARFKLLADKALLF